MLALSTLTDQELADLFRTGDPDAFTLIYKRYWKKIYVIALKRLGDEQEAEEVVQEIFLNFWRKRLTFKLTTAFNNYFAVAVKFEILDIMRKRANAAIYFKESGIDFSDADESLLRQLDMMELQQQLQLSIKALPEKCQLVFRLKHEQGYSQKEIAEELAISEKTVEAHLSTAKKKLRGTFGSLFGVIMFIFF